jgi:hypothetical protein
VLTSSIRTSKAYEAEFVALPQDLHDVDAGILVGSTQPFATETVAMTTSAGHAAAQWLQFCGDTSAAGPLKSGL